MIWWFIGGISVVVLYLVVFKPLIQDPPRAYWANEPSTPQAALQPSKAGKFSEPASFLEAQLAELAADYAVGKLQHADYEALVKAVKAEHSS